ncbi:MAG: hypothetical protein QW585_01370 [Candidatus Pacearchaeota archaeon]
MELQCLKCKYQFNAEKIPLICPFCSSKNTVKTLPNASDLLEEATLEEKKLEEAEKRKEEWKKKLEEGSISRAKV